MAGIMSVIVIPGFSGTGAFQAAANFSRTAGSATGWYPVSTLGSPPMSQAPWTLFWPRSGLTPPPGTPTLPQSMARLQQDLTLSTPVVCWVMPMAYSRLAVPWQAYSSAMRARSWGATPVILATRSGG